jgi:MSHA biogenesis protein MshN
VSVINKVLQELDRREAIGAADGRLPPQQVRAVHGKQAGREWFWRSIAALIVVALGWVGWLAWQLQPRAPVATQAAFKAAEDAQKKKQVAAIAKSAVPAPQAAPAAPAAAPAAAPSATPVPAQAAAAGKPSGEKLAALPQATSSKASPRPAVPTVDTLKLAFSIDTPIAPRVVAKSAATEKPTDLSVKSKGPAGKASTEASHSQVEKRETSPALKRAELEFRRGVALLNQGRLSEAEQGFSASLTADPSHEPARQAWAALLVEQGRFEDARTLLAQGLARNPAQVQFAVALARIVAGQGDYAGALEVLSKVSEPARSGADYHALQGALLQKLQRHEEAAQAYKLALQGAPEAGVSWVGLGISLEALGRRPEAADAFRRAIASGSINGEVKAYAESRARQLR